MAQRITQIPGIGQVILAKRRGNSNLRISITPNGSVRVSMPYWAPYSTGIAFAKSRQAWINKHLSDKLSVVFKNVDLIGKAHRIKGIRRQIRQMTRQIHRLPGGRDRL